MDKLTQWGKALVGRGSVQDTPQQPSFDPNGPNSMSPPPNFPGAEFGAGTRSIFGDSTSSELAELRRHLDGKTDREKLDAVKRLISNICQDIDSSSVYPDVVKLVITQNLILKKLVYSYLVYYAESQQEAALLTINNFQKDLGNQSPLLRAVGLRTLSNFRLPMIVQVLVVSARKSVKDTSPYVRKAAVMSLMKIRDLDPDSQEELIGILEIALADAHCMVLGAAMVAFNYLCPYRFGMLHKHYRKLCHFLVDFDEWTQIEALTALMRYGRNQFTDPNKDSWEKKDRGAPTESRGGEEWDSPSESEDSLFGDRGGQVSDLDPDHRALLTSSLPLLKSRNSGVVMGVVAVYLNLAPELEMAKVVRPLCRLACGPREVQWVALKSIAKLSMQSPQLLENAVAEFFVDGSEPLFVQLIKVEILANLLTEVNVGRVLSEIAVYVRGENESFVNACIRTLSRIAVAQPSVADQCIEILMNLVSSGVEAVVAEAVVVIKQLLQASKAQRSSKAVDDPEEFPLQDIVLQLGLTFDHVTSPLARASILWVMGEYCDVGRQLAPDVLRLAAKAYPSEAPAVRLQTLHLAAKLHVANPEVATARLAKYVFDMAAYDPSYDVRDRARCLRPLVFASEMASSSPYPSYLAAQRRLLLTEKPCPVLTNRLDFAYELGTLSMLLRHAVPGYQPLADFVAEAPDTDRTPHEMQFSKAEQAAAFGSPRGRASSSGSSSYSGDSYSRSGSSYSDSDSRSYSSQSRSPSPRRRQGRSSRGQSPTPPSRRRRAPSDSWSSSSSSSYSRSPSPRRQESPPQDYAAFGAEDAPQNAVESFDPTLRRRPAEEEGWGSDPASDDPLESQETFEDPEERPLDDSINPKSAEVVSGEADESDD